MLIVLIALAHGVGVTNGFTLDDFPTLLRNPAVTTQFDLSRILLDARTHNLNTTLLVYRPLRVLLFALEYRLFGPASALPYHVAGVLLHSIVAVLAFTLLRRRVGQFSAALAAAFVAVHPVSVEVVASVKGQEDSLAATFALGALLLLLKADSSAARRARSPLALPGFWIGAVLYASAVLSKESAIIVPALFLLWKLTEGGSQSSAADRGTLLRRTMAATGATLGVLLLVAVCVLALRSHAISSGAAGAVGVSGEGLRRFLWSLTVTPKYLKLLLWPSPLTIDYTHLAMPGEFAGSAAISIGCQLAALTAAFRFGIPAVRFGAAWFYLCLLPSQNLLGGFVPFAERFAYLPMVGAGFVLAGCIESIRSRAIAAGARPFTARAALALPAVAVIALIPFSFQRTREWRDNESLFRAALRVNPDARAMQLFLAGILAQKGELDEASRLAAQPASRAASADSPTTATTSARALDPLAANAASRQALIELKRGNYARAEALLRPVVQLPGADAADWMNFGAALVNLKKYTEAAAALRTSLKLTPTNAAAWRMLGRTEFESGQHAAAIEAFEASLRIEPKNPLAWYFLARSVRATKGDDAAADVIETARQRGVALGPVFLREDPVVWAGAEGKLRTAIEQLRAAGEGGGAGTPAPPGATPATTATGS